MNDGVNGIAHVRAPELDIDISQLYHFLRTKKGYIYENMQILRQNLTLQREYGMIFMEWGERNVRISIEIATKLARFDLGV